MTAVVHLLTSANLFSIIVTLAQPSSQPSNIMLLVNFLETKPTSFLSSLFRFCSDGSTVCVEADLDPAHDDIFRFTLLLDLREACR